MSTARRWSRGRGAAVAVVLGLVAGVAAAAAPRTDGQDGGDGKTPPPARVTFEVTIDGKTVDVEEGAEATVGCARGGGTHRVAVRRKVQHYESRAISFDYGPLIMLRVRDTDHGRVIVLEHPHGPVAEIRFYAGERDRVALVEEVAAASKADEEALGASDLTLTPKPVDMGGTTHVGKVLAFRTAAGPRATVTLVTLSGRGQSLVLAMRSADDQRAVAEPFFALLRRTLRIR